MIRIIIKDLYSAFRSEDACYCYCYAYDTQVHSLRQDKSKQSHSQAVHADVLVRTYVHEGLRLYSHFRCAMLCCAALVNTHRKSLAQYRSMCECTLKLREKQTLMLQEC